MLNLVRHAEEAVCTGARKLSHVSVYIDLDAMVVYVSESNIRLVPMMSKKLIPQTHRRRRLVWLEILRRFWDAQIWLTLAMPHARFLNGSLYFYMSLSSRKEEQNRKEAGRREK